MADDNTNTAAGHNLCLFLLAWPAFYMGDFAATQWAL